MHSCKDRDPEYTHDYKVILIFNRMIKAFIPECISIGYKGLWLLILTINSKTDTTKRPI